MLECCKTTLELELKEEEKEEEEEEEEEEVIRGTHGVVLGVMARVII